MAIEEFSTQPSQHFHEVKMNIFILESWEG